MAAANNNPSIQLATFGSGCFWCTEAIFQRLKGVVKVTSGYSGGKVENPSYEAVSAGNTGHAEVTQIQFDPDQINYEQLLEVFFSTHDPTTLNRQGNDVGEQYRSVIFYHNDEQKQQSEEIKQQIESEKIWGDKPLVTAIEPFTKFYPAEDYHQNYFNNNPQQAYCQVIINPKVAKFKEKFKNLLKK